MIATTTISQSYKELEQNVANGLDFIISLLREPIWPRTISTKTTEERQIPVYSKQEARARYKAANFLDCRISAYPPSYGYAAIQLIDLVMIDLGQSKFKSSQALDRTLSKTTKNIEETLGIEFEPTEIWSGNGYHIYIPVESRYVLEEKSEFSKFEGPSKRFLRFAEWYLSNGRCDPVHNNTVSFGNCMLRIPGSHNSKCVQRNNGISDFTTQVKITHKWNGYRPPAYLLIGSFLAYLVDQKIKEMKPQKQQFSKYSSKSTSITSNSIILWIEKLLQTPIEDHRKNTGTFELDGKAVNELNKRKYGHYHHIRAVS